MKQTLCDQCGEAVSYGLVLEDEGSHGITHDFCSEACVLDWALARVRGERDWWREKAQEEQAKGRKR